VAGSWIGSQEGPNGSGTSGGVATPTADHQHAEVAHGALGPAGRCRGESLPRHDRRRPSRGGQSLVFSELATLWPPADSAALRARPGGHPDV